MAKLRIGKSTNTARKRVIPAIFVLNAQTGSGSASRKCHLLQMYIYIG